MTKLGIEILLAFVYNDFIVMLMHQTASGGLALPERSLLTCTQ